MTSIRPQCKDIADRRVLEFLRRLERKEIQSCYSEGPRLLYWTPTTATWFEGAGGPRVAHSVLNAMPEGTPEKLALAKMKMLVRRGWVGGCTCGCRGDFHLTPEGHAALG